jgi:transposase
MRKKHIVTLVEEQRQMLLRLTSTGKNIPARKLTRARILLKADTGQGGERWSDEEISRALDVSTATVERVRALFAEGGLDAVIGYRRPKRFYERKLDEEARALLSVLFYTDPPNGRLRWTMGLLADKLVEFGYADQLSRETIRKVLKETGLNRT